jgi:hypothetical protein
MIGRPPRRRRLNALKAQLGDIQCIDESVDHANRIALVNPVIEAFRQQSGCQQARSDQTTMRPLHEGAADLKSTPKQSHRGGACFWRTTMPQKLSGGFGELRTPLSRLVALA